MQNDPAALAADIDACLSRVDALRQRAEAAGLDFRSLEPFLEILNLFVKALREHGTAIGTPETLATVRANLPLLEIAASAFESLTRASEAQRPACQVLN